MERTLADDVKAIYDEKNNAIKELSEKVRYWQNQWDKDHQEIFRHRWDAIVLQEALWIAVKRLAECKVEYWMSVSSSEQMGEAPTKNFVIELYNEILREAKEGHDVGGRRD